MTQSVDQQFTRFADLLEKNPIYTPVRHNMPPMWDLTRVDGGMPRELRAALAATIKPAANWGPRDVEADLPEGTPLQEIDANGAYVAAASSARFAHCALERTGPLDVMTGTLPGGIYLVDVHAWPLRMPGSPLGGGRLAADTKGRVWVPRSVYALLRDLVEGASWTPGGHWPDATVHDSWTADPTPFEKWSAAVRDVRTAAIIGGDTKHYGRIKVAYSQAVQMWAKEPDPKGTPVEKRAKKNKAYRPDWYAELRGQHFANMFRRSYTAAVVHGLAPLAVRGTDRLTFVEPQLLRLLGATKSPIRLDETGMQLGTFKRIGGRWYAGMEI